MTVVRDSIEQRDRVATVAIFAAALAVYFTTASRHLVGGDIAEFVTLFAYGGVAHPSGDPLYAILLRLCASPPLEPPASADSWRA